MFLLCSTWTIFALGVFIGLCAQDKQKPRWTGSSKTLWTGRWLVIVFLSNWVCYQPHSFMSLQGFVFHKPCICPSRKNVASCPSFPFSVQLALLGRIYCITQDVLIFRHMPLLDSLEALALQEMQCSLLGVYSLL